LLGVCNDLEVKVLMQSVKSVVGNQAHIKHTHTTYQTCGTGYMPGLCPDIYSVPHMQVPVSEKEAVEVLLVQQTHGSIEYTRMGWPGKAHCTSLTAAIRLTMRLPIWRVYNLSIGHCRCSTLHQSIQTRGHGDEGQATSDACHSQLCRPEDHSCDSSNDLMTAVSTPQCVAMAAEQAHTVMTEETKL
jgi:hypothetical protein